VLVLALKLVMAPAFVVGASVVARRFGPRIGGVAGGLPVVGGPILLVLAVVHDDAFAARSAATSLLGLVSLAAFVVAYARVAVRAAWPVALAAAWGAFALGTAAFALLTSALRIPPTPGLLAACASFLLAARVLPAAAPEDAAPGSAAAPVPTPAPPVWDLPARALCAALMVLAITGLSSGLGARVSGLLAPAPIITSILAAFAHAQAGPAVATALLRGMLTGFFSFAAFCWTIAILLPHTALGVAFTLAAVVAVLTQVAIRGGESIGARPYPR
jgi:hypothetical protein